MKYVLISLSESSKIDFSGVEKLAKTDHLVFVYVKGKKTLPVGVKAALEDLKAEIEYFEIGASAELWLAMSYLIGYHTASKHDTIVITGDKSKLPSKITKDAKVYSAFRAAVGGSASGTASSSKTSAKKTTAKKSTTAKSSTAKKTSTAKKSTTTKKTTATKKSTTAKKTSTSKSTAKKTAAKKKNPDVSDIITALSKGDTKSASKQITDLATSILKGKK
ncbi:MAG: hypothetical protein IK020_08920 [Clostridiales bacterium]|nr:hypothetical protein [Clostridiales bacterium]